MFRSRTTPADLPRGWWTRGWVLALLVLATAIPLIWPTVPPLTDLPEHMGRYRIELSPPDSPLRTTFFSFSWHYLANLGVDLLIVPLAPVFGLQLGVKLIVIAIVMLTASGILWIAREAHGTVPATAFLALPLAYSFPLIWGFVNYMLSMALALNAFALWLRLGRQERWRLRSALFVVIGLLLTTAHVFGWAVLCLLAFAAETVRKRDAGKPLWRSLWEGGLACLPLAPPILLLLVWRAGDVAARNRDWFFWEAKYIYLVSAIRSTNEWTDKIPVFLMTGSILLGLTGFGLRMNRTLGIATVMLLLAYVLLPRILLGSAYADMRLAPFVLMAGVVALRPVAGSPRLAGMLATGAIALFAGRLWLLTADFAARHRIAEHQLAALDHVQPHSRVFVKVNLLCLGHWTTTRLDHMGAMAIVRRGAFANGQWTDPGAQLVRITYRPAKGFAEDPTEILRPPRCTPKRSLTYPDAVNRLPRDAFDYVWLIDMPRDRWYSFPGLTPIWNGGRTGILYRVDPSTGSATSPMEIPAGRSPRTAA